MSNWMKRNEQGMPMIEVVPAEWPADVKAAQEAILSSKGYLPLVRTERPADTETRIWSAKYVLNDDTWYESYVAYPLIIRLDRTKLIAALVAAGLYQTALSVIQADPEAAAWWTDNLTYVAGSSMAAKLRAALGISEETLEAIALACREN